VRELLKRINRASSDQFLSSRLLRFVKPAKYATPASEMLSSSDRGCGLRQPGNVLQPLIVDAGVPEFRALKFFETFNEFQAALSHVGFAEVQ
jgi:hypothetical protein